MEGYIKRNRRRKSKIHNGIFSKWENLARTVRDLAELGKNREQW